jgi:Proprotein convertase P-domain
VLALAAASAGWALAGCEAGSPRSCTVTCGDQGGCPDGTSCGTDGYCYAPAEVDGSCTLVGEPDASGVDGPDAAVGRPDAAVDRPDAAVDRPDAAVDPRPDACAGPDSFAGIEADPASIPDGSLVGVASTIVAGGAAGCVVVDSVQIRIDITHTFRGDLSVFLTPPVGQTVLVVPPSNDSDDDIHQTFDLAIAAGQSAVGQWTLTVIDDVAQDAGTLDRWSIGINQAAP